MTRNTEDCENSLYEGHATYRRLRKDCEKSLPTPRGSSLCEISNFKVDLGEPRHRLLAGTPSTSATVSCSRLSWLAHGRAMLSRCYSEMSNWSNSSWCYCHLILGELKIEKSVIRFGGIKSGIKTPEIPLVNELGQYFCIFCLLC